MKHPVLSTKYVGTTHGFVVTFFLLWGNVFMAL